MSVVEIVGLIIWLGMGVAILYLGWTPNAKIRVQVYKLTKGNRWEVLAAMAALTIFWPVWLAIDN